MSVGAKDRCGSNGGKEGEGRKWRGEEKRRRLEGDEGGSWREKAGENDSWDREKEEMTDEKLNR